MKKKVILLVGIVAIFICLFNPYNIIKQKYIRIYTQEVCDLGESYIWWPDLRYLYLASVEDQQKMIDILKRTRPTILVYAKPTDTRILIGKNEIVLHGDVVAFPEEPNLYFKLTEKDSDAIYSMFANLDHSLTPPEWK